MLVTTKYSTQLSIRQLDAFNDDLEYQIKIKRTRARNVLHVFSNVEKIADPRSFIQSSILHRSSRRSMLNRLQSIYSADLYRAKTGLPWNPSCYHNTQAATLPTWNLTSSFFSLHHRQYLLRSPQISLVRHHQSHHDSQMLTGHQLPLFNNAKPSRSPSSLHFLGSAFSTRWDLAYSSALYHVLQMMLIWHQAFYYGLRPSTLYRLDVCYWFFGAVADIVGAKLVWVTGSFLYAGFTIAVGLSKTGVQLILFRTFLGIAISMCLPTAVSLITNTFPKGKWRNIAFASNGTGQPLGYSAGLLLGGVFTDTIGWRWSFFVSAIINFAISMTAIWVLPPVYRPSDKAWTRRLVEDIDWLGAAGLSTALGILLYILATTTSSYRRFSEVQNIVLLVVSILLLAVFPLYMDYQIKHQRPAIIPNKLWRNAAFTTTCVAVFFCWVSLNAIQYFTTL